MDASTAGFDIGTIMDDRAYRNLLMREAKEAVLLDEEHQRVMRQVRGAVARSKLLLTEVAAERFADSAQSAVPKAVDGFSYGHGRRALAEAGNADRTGRQPVLGAGRF